jgi:phospholipid/cholesterol/gamma-HCH transport system substrate-binding protein
MNNFRRKFRSNFFPVVVFSAIVLGCGLALYLFHPASPHHDRYSFVVRYESIGTLSPGNRVEVRGITKGEIEKVDLTEDAVFVTARVLADTKIPKNSEFRLKTAGLMGERELSVLTGDGQDFIADGDTVHGHYEEGANAVGRNLAIILSELDSITTQLGALKDSVTKGTAGKRVDRVLKKGDNLIQVSRESVQEWVGSAMDLLSKAEGTLDQAKSTLGDVSGKADGTVQKVENLVARVDSLLSMVHGAKEDLEGIEAKLDQDNNTVGLILSKKGDIHKELDIIGVDIDALIKDIRKQGLKLNADIF